MVVSTTDMELAIQLRRLNHSVRFLIRTCAATDYCENQACTDQMKYREYSGRPPYDSLYWVPLYRCRTRTSQISNKKKEKKVIWSSLNEFRPYIHIVLYVYRHDILITFFAHHYFLVSICNQKIKVHLLIISSHFKKVGLYLQYRIQNI